MAAKVNNLDVFILIELKIRICQSHTHAANVSLFY